MIIDPTPEEPFQAAEDAAADSPPMILPLIGIRTVRRDLLMLRHDLAFLAQLLEDDPVGTTRVGLAIKTLTEAMEALEEVR